MPSDSISQYQFFKISLEGMPPDLPINSMLHMLSVFYTITHTCAIPHYPTLNMYMPLKSEHIIIPEIPSLRYTLLTEDHTTLPPSIPLHLIFAPLAKILKETLGST